MNIDSKKKTTRGVGSFAIESDRDFRDSLAAALESFEENFRVSPIYKMTDIVTNDVLFEQFKDSVFADVLDASMESSFAHYDDESGYMTTHADKMEQLIANTREEMVNEAAAFGQLSPIVSLTLPIMKKEYLEMNFKEILQTVVADKPVINIAYERKFLKDVQGNKYYIPDIFYDNSYREITQKSVGRPVSDKWYPETGELPVQDLDMLVESGGSIERRDQLSYDFRIAAVKVEVEGDSGKEVIEVPVDCKPDSATAAFSYTLEVSDVKSDESQNKKHKCQVYGSFDPYAGKVSVAGIGIKQVKFGGHLSNSNNTEIVELDRERKNIQYTIAEKERFNTGITIERIKDEKALANIDTTVELVADMTEVCAQTKDSNIKVFLEESFQRTLGAKDFAPMGYNIQFARSVGFDMQKAKDYMIPESEWRSPQLRMYLGRVIGQMKQLLRNTAVMFVISGNPYTIERFFETDDKCRWLIDNNTKIGGVKFDYKFGVTTMDGCRIHIIASMKEDIEKGLRIVAYPLSETVLTYRQYDYSFNIENNYRNPLTPNIPNIMAVQRYENIEYLPVQWEFYIQQFRDGNLGFSPYVD